MSSQIIHGTLYDTSSKLLFNFVLSKQKYIDEVSTDEDGHWIYLRQGFCKEYQGRGHNDTTCSHIYHEEHVKDIIAMFKSFPPEPCDCERCSHE